MEELFARILQCHASSDLRSPWHQYTEIVIGWINEKTIDTPDSLTMTYSVQENDHGMVILSLEGVDGRGEYSFYITRHFCNPNPSEIDAVYFAHDLLKLIVLDCQKNDMLMGDDFNLEHIGEMFPKTYGDLINSPAIKQIAIHHGNSDKEPKGCREYPVLPKDAYPKPKGTEQSSLSLPWMILMVVLWSISGILLFCPQPCPTIAIPFAFAAGLIKLYGPTEIS